MNRTLTALILVVALLTYRGSGRYQPPGKEKTVNETSTTTWRLERDGNEVGMFERAQIEKVVRELKKLHPNSHFRTTYIGRSIDHCGQGGKAL